MLERRQVEPTTQQTVLSLLVIAGKQQDNSWLRLVKSFLFRINKLINPENKQNIIENFRSTRSRVRNHLITLSTLISKHVNPYSAALFLDLIKT
jgi:hypothetical protein